MSAPTTNEQERRWSVSIFFNDLFARLPTSSVTNGGGNSDSSFPKGTPNAHIGASGAALTADRRSDAKNERTYIRQSVAALRNGNIAQLQIIANELYEHIQIRNEELVRLLEERDELNMAHDSLIVDARDLKFVVERQAAAAAASLSRSSHSQDGSGSAK